MVIRFYRYSALEDVRVAQVDFDVETLQQAAPFDIVRMELDGRKIGSAFSFLIFISSSSSSNIPPKIAKMQKWTNKRYIRSHNAKHSFFIHNTVQKFKKELLVEMIYDLWTLHFSVLKNKENQNEQEPVHVLAEQIFFFRNYFGV